MNSVNAKIGIARYWRMIPGYFVLLLANNSVHLLPKFCCIFSNGRQFRGIEKFMVRFFANSVHEGDPEPVFQVIRSHIEPGFAMPDCSS